MAIKIHCTINRIGPRPKPSIPRTGSCNEVRSLNLSNCVALVSYEVLRQLDYPKLIRTEPEKHKGKDFLDQFKEKNT